jgi:hypothetical protein
MFKATTREGVLAEVNAAPDDGDITHGFGEFWLLEDHLEQEWGIVMGESGEFFVLKDKTFQCWCGWIDKGPLDSPAYAKDHDDYAANVELQFGERGYPPHEPSESWNLPEPDEGDTA